jgi:hypothetical protein
MVEGDVSTHHRFVLNERNKIIDKLNPGSDPMGGPSCEGEPDDQFYMREMVLYDRLYAVTDRLTDRINGGHDIVWLLQSAICASHLHTFDPALSIKNRFDGTLKHKKRGVQEFTSLSLFIDDVERILRDLYGDIESDALERTMFAAFGITRDLLQYVRKDLWQEYRDAQSLDYGLYAIGVPEGCGIGGGEWRSGVKAEFDLALRAREVIENPFAFSQYTVEFASWYRENVRLPVAAASNEQGREILKWINGSYSGPAYVKTIRDISA